MYYSIFNLHKLFEGVYSSGLKILKPELWRFLKNYELVNFFLSNL